MQPLCIKTLAISATPATALLTEVQPGCVVEVPSHPHLVYIGLDKVLLRTQVDSDAPEPSAATVTEASMQQWMERYIGPMLQDMVSGYITLCWQGRGRYCGAVKLSTRGSTAGYMYS